MTDVPKSSTMEFERYIQTVEAVDKDVNIVDWWGVSTHLLFDYILLTQKFEAQCKSISNMGVACT